MLFLNVLSVNLLVIFSTSFLENITNYLVSLITLNFYGATIIKSLIVIIFVLVNVAYLTLLERKVLGAIQRRMGPNVVGAYGLLQPLADGFKLFVKEPIIPSVSNQFLFLAGPVISFTASLFTWGTLAFNNLFAFSHLNLGILITLVVSATGAYGILLAGWSSNSKYAFLGSLRLTAQVISYELALAMIISTIALLAGSFNISDIVEAQSNGMFFWNTSLLAFIFFICSLAETNRHPFDLPEAEAELVSGYNVEYAGMSFALFSLAEYSAMLIMGCLNVILFYGGWIFFGIQDSFIFGSIIFAIKLMIIMLLILIMRALLPRYRYDQLMDLGWKALFPTSLAFFTLTFIMLYLNKIYPY